MTDEERHAAAMADPDAQADDRRRIKRATPRRRGSRSSGARSASARRSSRRSSTSPSARCGTGSRGARSPMPPPRRTCASSPARRTRCARPCCRGRFPNGKRQIAAPPTLKDGRCFPQPCYRRPDAGARSGRPAAPIEPDGQEHRQRCPLFRRRRGRPRADGAARGAERGGAGGPAGRARQAQAAAAHRAHRGGAAARRRRQGAALRRGAVRVPGRADPPRLRLHGRQRLPRHQPLRCRAHGHHRHRRLRPRPARPLLRRRSAVPAALQADALGRERGGVHALSAVGPGAEGRPRHAHRRAVAQARRAPTSPSAPRCSIRA